jgi:Ricin-type beta-trefoil lectin domain
MGESRRRGHGASRRAFALIVGGLLVAGLAPVAAFGAAASGASAGSASGATAAESRPRAVSGGSRSALFIRPHVASLPDGERRVCPVPTEAGEMTCQAILPGRAGASGIVSASGGSSAGYGPADLQSAYGLTSASADRGKGETVAIVDAYSNPDLVRNLATYRKDFHLPACGTKNGCLRIVNEHGRTSPLPAANSGWGTEESLDLDMVSAVCPHCRILLVQASAPNTQDLGLAEASAVRMGARFVSNSWSGSEFIGQDAFNSYFNHPGDAIVFASGDFGYGPQYPTDTQFVTAVGGTTLVRTKSGRRWSERVWGDGASSPGTGSGCSTLEAKPSWQTADDSAPRGCLNRTENDVAAVADPNTGVAMLDTYGTGERSLFEIGGTSVATPIITATYALAGDPARGSYAAEYPYIHRADFHDVVTGSNGQCEANRQYLCHGERGYNGPTGVGTPGGTAGLSSSGVPGVTVLDPGTQDAGTGASVRVTVPAVTTDAKARSLSYSAAGLPAGLRITSAPHSLDGVITGRLPATAGTYRITVRARDARTHKSATTRFSVYVVGSLTSSSSAELAPGPIAVTSTHGTGCMSAATATAGAAVVMEPCSDASAAQSWQLTSQAAPGSPDTLTIAAGICLGLSGTSAQLQACNGSAGQQWQYDPASTVKGVPLTWLVNPASGLCLNGRNVTTAGQQVQASPCNPAYTSYGENWTIEVTLLLESAQPGDCASGSPSGLYGFAEVCNPANALEPWLASGGQLDSPDDDCLVENGLLDSSVTTFASCGVVSEVAIGFWLPGPGGELINANSGRCLDDEGRGLKLVQDDCYGLPGEIWAFN